MSLSRYRRWFVEQTADCVSDATQGAQSAAAAASSATQCPNKRGAGVHLRRSIPKSHRFCVGSDPSTSSVTKRFLERSAVPCTPGSLYRLIVAGWIANQPNRCEPISADGGVFTAVTALVSRTAQSTGVSSLALAHRSARSSCAAKVANWYAGRWSRLFGRDREWFELAAAADTGGSVQRIELGARLLNDRVPRHPAEPRRVRIKRDRAREFMLGQISQDRGTIHGAAIARQIPLLIRDLAEIGSRGIIGEADGHNLLWREPDAGDRTCRRPRTSSTYQGSGPRAGCSPS